MLKKLMKVLLIILSSIIVLAALLFGYAKTRIYIKDLKREQKLMQNMKFVEKRNNKKVYIDELLRKNDNITRVDIYNVRSIINELKSVDKFPLIGSITDENQLKEFKNIFKKTISSSETNRYFDDIPNIAIIILYDDNTKIPAFTSPGGKNNDGLIDFKAHKNYGITGKNKMRFHLVMPYKLWLLIKDNMILSYKKDQLWYYKDMQQQN